jgi:hypothetical protein
MDFTVEFYEKESGACPVQEFLDDLKDSDPDDFAVVVGVWQNCATASITASRYPRRAAVGFLSCAMSANSIPACCGSL